MIALKHLKSSKFKLVFRITNFNTSKKYLLKINSKFFSSISTPVPLLNEYFRLNLSKKPKNDFDNLNNNFSNHNNSLEDYLFETLKRKFNFSDQHCKEICFHCKPIFDTHMSDVESIDDVVSYVGENFLPNDIIYNPQVFAIHPRTLKQRIEIITELGFEKFYVTQIDSMFNVQMNQTPMTVKNMGLYPVTRDAAQYIVDIIPCPNYVKQDTINQICHSDFVKFITLRQIFLSHYLSWKLDCSPEQALKIVIKKSSRIKNSSLLNLSKGINLLIDEKLPPKRLLSSSFLIGSHYKNTELIFNNIKQVAGFDFKELCNKYPRLLDTKYETLKNNLDVLKEFKIRDDQILKGIDVLTLSTETLRKRLTLFNEIDDFKPFRDNPRAMRIVLAMKSVLDRVEVLKSLECLTITIDQLIGSNKYFQKVMFQHEHSNKTGIIFYLTRFLQVDPSSITHIGLHPFSNRILISNANKIVEYFISQNFTRQQLINGIYIVLYDYDFVKHQYQEMIRTDEFQPFDVEWKQHPFVLQLLIYYIEKKYNFTGNGVFITQQYFHIFSSQQHYDYKKSHHLK